MNEVYSDTIEKFRAKVTANSKWQMSIFTMWLTKFSFYLLFTVNIISTQK